MTDERQFDVVIWGATGFTGKLVAEYLARSYDVDHTRWAIAGRNQAKLEAVRDELAKINEQFAILPILLGDSHDEASLHAMAAKTKVVCTTVGPYAKYGSALVAACVAEGTHYCDLTGEVHWAKRMIDEHHEQAVANKVKIVHFSGYDSIPSDLGSLMVQQAMHDKHGCYCEEIKFFAGPTKGGFSGGTIDSMVNMFQEIKDPETRKSLGNPYALHPVDTPRGPRVKDQDGVRWDEDFKVWTGPFVMARVNTRTVRRSQAVLGMGDPEQFRYTEVMSFPKGFKGWMAATSVALGLGTFGLLMIFPPTRKLLLATVLPAPGEGPSEEARESGYFTSYLVGKAGEHRVYAMVRGEKDPGYGGTAIMLAESALCLALNQEESPQHFGVITPAIAMGTVLIERLKNAGMRFEVGDAPIFYKRSSATS